MKKVIITAIAALVVVTMTSMTLGISYHITNDDCEKCTINASTKKCGKCKSNMESHYIRQEGTISSGIKLYYRADCTNCDHSAYYYTK